MKFEQADYDEIERTCTTTATLGYIITLGGKPFLITTIKECIKPSRVLCVH